MKAYWMKVSTKQNVNQNPIGESFGEVASHSSFYKIIHIRATYSTTSKGNFNQKPFAQILRACAKMEKKKKIYG